MILNTLIAFLVILGLLAGWIFVQQWARAFAARHPEFGPAREEGGGCFFCMCTNRDSCRKPGKGVKTALVDSPAGNAQRGHDQADDPSSHPVSTSPTHPFENANPSHQEKKS